MIQSLQTTTTQSQTPRLTTDDVQLLRTIAQAQAVVCNLAQRISDRQWMIYPPSGEPIVCWNLAVVRAWLRHYAECGRYGRRCFDQTGQHTCQCHPRSRQTVQRHHW